MPVYQHEAAVVALEAHEVFDAVARLIGAAQVGYGFQQERAINHPQPAVAGGADLEGGQALLDFARLVNVADGGVQQGLHAGIRDLEVVVGQRCRLPEALGHAPQRVGVRKVNWHFVRVSSPSHNKGQSFLGVRRNLGCREVEHRPSLAFFHGDDAAGAEQAGPLTEPQAPVEGIQGDGPGALDRHGRRHACCAGPRIAQVNEHHVLARRFVQGGIHPLKDKPRLAFGRSQRRRESKRFLNYLDVAVALERARQSARAATPVLASPIGSRPATQR